MIPFEEFKKVANSISDPIYTKDWKYATDVDYEDIHKYLIQVSYIGGYTGGSCWKEDDSDIRYENTDEIVTFKNLDTFLTKVAPNISYLRYKEIVELAQEGYYTENEYYGNTSDYKVFYLDLKDLYAVLTE